MISPSSLTAFQAAARTVLGRFLTDLGLSAEFEKVKCGENIAGGLRPNEYYLRIQGEVSEHAVEVFIYSDEIGFYCDGEWKIAESQDFEEEDELIQYACEELRICVGGKTE